jgi:hypothetical protein
MDGKATGGPNASGKKHPIETYDLRDKLERLLARRRWTFDSYWGPVWVVCVAAGAGATAWAVVGANRMGGKGFFSGGETLVNLFVLVVVWGVASLLIVAAIGLAWAVVNGAFRLLMGINHPANAGLAKRIEAHDRRLLEAQPQGGPPVEDREKPAAPVSSQRTKAWVEVVRLSGEFEPKEDSSQTSELIRLEGGAQRLDGWVFGGDEDEGCTVTGDITATARGTRDWDAEGDGMEMRDVEGVGPINEEWHLANGSYDLEVDLCSEDDPWGHPKDTLPLRWQVALLELR